MPSQRTQSRSRAFTVAASVSTVAGLLGLAYYLDLPSLLQQRVKSRKVSARCYSQTKAPSVVAFKTLVEQTTLRETYPLASDVQKSIPIYDCRTFDEKQESMLQDELYHILVHGPGVFVLQNFYTDHSSIDSANAAYEDIIERELEQNGAKGDHFAAAGTNSRIWNSFSKHCRQDPQSFVEYYSNPLFRTVCEAYLGPGYRITSQVNIVKPGGKPQVCHRDYHLGFQTAADCSKFPKALHHASAFLTLQGAVAHTDMPLDSGPTRFLPFSQQFEEGFMAYRLPEFNQYFLDHFVSLPLRKGDAVFFSPALFHAAGENITSSFSRSANLVQVSAAFGKTMETIDSLPLIEDCYDLLKVKTEEEGGISRESEAFIKAVAEGYSFPTNLDRRPPAPGGMAPESEQELLRKALVEGWEKDRFLEELRTMRADSMA